MITDIENSSSGSYLNLSLNDIYNFYKHFPLTNIGLDETFDINEFLLSNIPKMNINLNKKKN